MRRPKSLLRTVGLLLTIVAVTCSSLGCAPGDRPDGDPLQTVKSNLKWYVAASANGDEGVRCIDFDKDYYLIELQSESEAFRYIWVDKRRTSSRYAVGTDGKPRLEKCENGEA